MLTNVLLNFFRMFREELETARVPNIEKTLQTGFQTWFRCVCVCVCVDRS
jgi:hypothetical protein